MFESLALEHPRNTRRNWTTALSFAVQTTGLALLVLAPIGYTQAVAPKFAEQIIAPVGMTSVDTQPAGTTQEHSASGPTTYHESTVTYIEAGRNFHPRTNVGSNTQPFDATGNYVIGATNSSSGPMDRLLAEMRREIAVGPPPVNTHTKPFPVSHLDAGMLIKQVQPAYPVIARQAGIEGKVLLVAIIDTQGRITNLRALSGHPLLIPAAINAVEQWRYRPYILNGQAVEVETQISVNFTLHRD